MVAQSELEVVDCRAPNADFVRDIVTGSACPVGVGDVEVGGDLRKGLGGFGIEFTCQSTVMGERLAQLRTGDVTPQIAAAGVQDEAQFLPGRADGDVAEVEGFL